MHIREYSCTRVFASSLILIYVGLPTSFYWTATAAHPLTISEIQATGKVLFRALRDSECKVRCKSGKSRPVCGSDGVTYQSKCELKRAKRCEGKNVNVRKKGKCSANAKPMTKCLQERKEALQSSSQPGTTGVFIPECKKDGSFTEVQCHSATGYCWCVDKEGRPVPRTASREKRPSCRGGTKKLPTRRNGKRKKNGDVGCSSVERGQFNSNLVGVFTEEYNRTIALVATPTPIFSVEDPILDILDKKVVEWKFSELDKDQNDRLRRKEVKSLRRIIKKVMKPRACAKQFIKYCDKNRDKFIERKEWSLCLGVDTNNEQTTPAPSREPSPIRGEGIPDFTFLLNRTRKPASNFGDRPFELPRSQQRDPSQHEKSRPRQEEEREVSTQRDCLGERSSALEEHAQNPNGGIFVPECTEIGKWSNAQCHTSTQYCWCVDQETGRPIAGTSTHMVKPKCNFDTERQMKGCTYAQKRRFVADLLSRLSADMANDVDNRNDTSKTVPTSEAATMSLQERVVRWKFSNLDENSNKVLDREEGDTFKDSLRHDRDKYTRKCSRNFVRFCDENGDKKITLDEWVDCMGIKHNFAVSLPKRHGRNPFNEYLRDT